MSEEQSSQETHEVENNRPGQAGVFVLRPGVSSVRQAGNIN